MAAAVSAQTGLGLSGTILTAHPFACLYLGNEALHVLGLLRMGGTGLEPVTPSLSIRRIDQPRLRSTHQTARLLRFPAPARVSSGVGWSPKARPC